MLNVFIIGLGSALGGMSRYLLASAIQRWTMFYFPLGTLVVNVIGSFLIGVLFSLLSSKLSQSAIRLDAFFVIGFLGGFTTFSAFSLQAIQLMQNKSIWLAASYILATIILCLIACYVGMYLIKSGFHHHIKDMP